MIEHRHLAASDMKKIAHFGKDFLDEAPTTDILKSQSSCDARFGDHELHSKVLVCARFPSTRGAPTINCAAHPTPLPLGLLNPVKRISRPIPWFRRSLSDRRGRMGGVPILPHYHQDP